MRPRGRRTERGHRTERRHDERAGVEERGDDGVGGRSVLVPGTRLVDTLRPVVRTRQQRGADRHQGRPRGRPPGGTTTSRQPGGGTRDVGVEQACGGPRHGVAGPVARPEVTGGRRTAGGGEARARGRHGRELRQHAGHAERVRHHRGTEDQRVVHHHVGVEGDGLPDRGGEHASHRGPHLGAQVVRDRDRGASGGREHPTGVQAEGHGVHVRGCDGVVGECQSDLVTAGGGVPCQRSERLHVASGACGEQHHAHPTSVARAPSRGADPRRVRSTS